MDVQNNYFQGKFASEVSPEMFQIYPEASKLELLHQSERRIIMNALPSKHYKIWWHIKKLKWFCCQQKYSESTLRVRWKKCPHKLRSDHRDLVKTAKRKVIMMVVVVLCKQTSIQQELELLSRLSIICWKKYPPG